MFNFLAKLRHHNELTEKIDDNLEQLLGYQVVLSDHIRKVESELKLLRQEVNELKGTSPVICDVELAFKAAEQKYKNNLNNEKDFLYFDVDSLL